jgi:hypothetical protein
LPSRASVTASSIGEPSLQENWAANACVITNALSQLSFGYTREAAPQERVLHLEGAVPALQLAYPILENRVNSASTERGASSRGILRFLAGEAQPAMI